MSGLIYLAKPVGMDGPIKIGCSRSPDSRLDQLSAWSPFALEVIATFPGTLRLERNIHDCLAASHSHKEWFFATLKVKRFVAAIVAGVAVEKAIDLSDREGEIRRKPWTAAAKFRAKYTHRLRFARDVVPTDVKNIVDRWSFFGGAPPTPAEIALLDFHLPPRLGRRARARAAPAPEHAS